MVLTPTALAKQTSGPWRRVAQRFLQAATLMLQAPFRLMHSPLTRSGYALTASAVLTSIVGLAFWILAARLYTPEHLGVSAALISTLPILGLAAQLNLGSVLNRFLPDAGAGARGLILIVYGASLSAALIISSGFLLTVGYFVVPLAFLAESLWTAAWFIFAVAAWTLFALQDSVLVGLRQSIWVPIENAVYAVAKIALLALLANSATAAFGPFAAWTLPLFFMIPVVNFIIFRRFLPEHTRSAELTARLDLRIIARFFGWDYVGMLAMMVAAGVTPILVLGIAGAAANAKYYIAETIGYSLYLIGRSMGAALLAEGVANRNRLPALSADALVHTALPLGACVVVVFVGAPLIMALFGTAYVEEGTPLLRVFALSTIPWAFVTIRLAVARVEGRTAMVAVVQGATLMLVLGLGFVLLGKFGALGMAIAWLAAHTTVAIGIGVVALLKGGPDRGVEWLFDLVSSTARVATTIQLRRHKLATVADPEQIVRAILHAAGEPESAVLRPLRTIVSQSDCLTVYLGEAETVASAGINPRRDGARVLFKKAGSPEGAASLERTLIQLASLRSDPRIASCGFRLPEILAVNRASDAIRVVESRIPGEDGRETLQRSRDRDAALAAAVHAVGDLHERTAEYARIDQAWLAEWIDRPVRSLRHALPALGSTDRRRAAIAAFRSQQHSFWHDRSVRLGWGHGDFSPGNIIFTKETRHQAAACGHVHRDGETLAVSGIVDWDRARPDSPGGFDACYLAITARALARGEQVGQTVRALLHAPIWQKDEEAWLSTTDGPTGWPLYPETVRAMVGLTWLHHVAANIEKSRRYAVNRFWVAANVDWVLKEYN